MNTRIKQIIEHEGLTDADFSMYRTGDKTCHIVSLFKWSQ